MKKIKTLWNNNRVLFVLGAIVIICFIVMIVVGFNLFFGANNSPYGDRLNDISGISLNEEAQNKIINKLQENEVVDRVSVHTQGKIIYIRIVYKNVSLDRAKEIAGTALEVISEEHQKLYDIHFTLVQDQTETTAGFTIMGSKNINGNTTIIWNNNTAFETTKE